MGRICASVAAHLHHPKATRTMAYGGAAADVSSSTAYVLADLQHEIAKGASVYTDSLSNPNEDGHTPRAAQQSHKNGPAPNKLARPKGQR